MFLIFKCWPYIKLIAHAGFADSEKEKTILWQARVTVNKFVTTTALTGDAGAVAVKHTAKQ